MAKKPVYPAVSGWDEKYHRPVPIDRLMPDLPERPKAKPVKARIVRNVLPEVGREILLREKFGLSPNRTRIPKVRKSYSVPFGR
jgi:hypothetical protein